MQVVSLPPVHGVGQYMVSAIFMQVMIHNVLHIGINLTTMSLLSLVELLLDNYTYMTLLSRAHIV